MMKEKIELLLTEAFNPSFLQIVDESHKHAGHAGALQGGHYQVVIVSKSFEGKKLLDSHRMIYQALTPIKANIHALSIKVKSNEQR